MLALILPALLAAAPHRAPDDSLMGPGVSRALAARRARQLGDVRYDLALDVTRHDTAYGRVVIRFRRRGAGDAILDFRGPGLDVERVNGRAPGAGVEWNGMHARVAGSLLRPGENVVEARFAALVAPAGASVIRVRDAADGASYLYTLLVPSDANALFPCFDQPDLKARVTLALAVPATWTAVANGAAVDSAASAARARSASPRHSR